MNLIRAPSFEIIFFIINLYLFFFVFYPILVSKTLTAWNAELFVFHNLKKELELENN